MKMIWYAMNESTTFTMLDNTATVKATYRDLPIHQKEHFNFILKDKVYNKATQSLSVSPKTGAGKIK